MGKVSKVAEIQTKYQVTTKIEGTIIGVRQVQNRGRVQIPKIVRDKLRLKDGDAVYWVDDGSKFYIAKAVAIK